MNEIIAEILDHLFLVGNDDLDYNFYELDQELQDIIKSQDNLDEIRRLVESEHDYNHEED